MLNHNRTEKLEDVVQVDETFIGGKNKNRHADKKVENSQGRSVKDKTPILGVRSLDGKVKTQVIKDTKAETIKPVIEQWVKEGSIMVSDEWKAYNSLRKDYFHISVNHSEGEYVRGAFHTNGIENFWSVFKRGYIGIYHYMSKQHLHRYCAEFGYI
jgi:transposase-like protein